VLTSCSSNLLVQKSFHKFPISGCNCILALSAIEILAFRLLEVAEECKDVGWFVILSMRV
jgi:hypothetical protein